VTIDGQPAGVSPVYPWNLYRRPRPFLCGSPFPSCDAANFCPSVDLTPFPPRCWLDGIPIFSASASYNADSYFLATANLLAYTDRGQARISGGLLNTHSRFVSGSRGQREHSASRRRPTRAAFLGRRTANSPSAASGALARSRAHHAQAEHELPEPPEFDVTHDRQSRCTAEPRGVFGRSTRAGGDEFVSEQHFISPLRLNYSFVRHLHGTATRSPPAIRRS